MSGGTLRHIAAALAAVAVITPSCSSGDDGAVDPSTSTTTIEPPVRSGPIVLSGQGNNLDAYSFDDEGAAGQRVITNADQDPDGLDINGQLCVFERNGAPYLVAGEDTDQPDPPAGWGIFELRGDAVGELGAEQLAKLAPTYQADTDQPENFGCGVLEDGRILTTDVGDQVQDANGQLIVWFPPDEAEGTFPGGDWTYCKLDTALPTGQSILVTGSESFLVAAARGGVFGYDGELPTDDTPGGGCDTTDATGAPTSSALTRTTVVEPGADGMATPAGLSPAPDGGFYASSVFSGVINEYDGNGAFRRTVLAPPTGETIGETIGEEPYSTGTPLGLATDAEGNLWYADIGLVISESGVGPGAETGTVRVIRFEGAQPSPPEVVAGSLTFPDGLGTFTP